MPVWPRCPLGGGVGPQEQQIVDVPAHVDLAEFSGEAGSPWSTTSDTTSTVVTALATSVAKSIGEVGETRPLEIAQQSATAAASAAATSSGFGEARPPKVAVWGHDRIRPRRAFLLGCKVQGHDSRRSSRKVC